MQTQTMLRGLRAAAVARSLPKLPLHNKGDVNAVFDLHTKMMVLNPQGFRTIGRKRGITKPEVRNRFKRMGREIVGAA